MKRRGFIVLVGVSAVGWPFEAVAQITGNNPI
jgi:hypothetical protein